MPRRLMIVKTILFAAILLAVPFVLFGRGEVVQTVIIAGPKSVGSLSLFEEKLRYSLPMSRELERLGMELRFAGGQRELNGIIIGEDALVRNIAPPSAEDIADNSKALVDFALRLLDVSNRKEQTYLAVIPTAGAILDGRLPRFAASRMVNQRRVIEDIYSQVSPSVRTMDVYSSLDDHDGEYLYYRTEDNLTSLGGYYAYYAMGRRLGIGNRGLNRYEVEYAARGFYGGLYHPSGGALSARNDFSPYAPLEPDHLALYRYGYTPREYTLTHTGGDGKKTYHTLFPKSAMLLGAPTDVYLGGSAPRMELVTSDDTASTSKTSLLVFGDKTAAAFLPFLVNHYQQVTLCDLSLMDESEIRALRPDLYGEVIFAYSIESYIHETDHAARIALIDWDSIYAVTG